MKFFYIKPEGVFSNWIKLGMIMLMLGVGGSCFAIDYVSVVPLGNWNTNTSWSPIGVPGSGDNVIINAGHIIFTEQTVNRGSGTTTVNGAFQLSPGGFADGTNFTYGPNGTLNFATGGNFGVDNNHVFWPVSNGPVNVNIISTFPRSDFTLNGATRTINGTLAVAGGVALNGSGLILNGIFQINAFGFSNNTPIYGSGSTLIYNSGENYIMGNEWNAGQNNGVTAGAGVPNNVIVQGSGTNLSVSGNRGLAGNLSVTNNATLNLNNFDLFTKANIAFTGTGAITYATIDAKIRFCANGIQQISSVAAQAFPAFWCDPPAGSNIIQLQSDIIIANPAGANAVNFGSGINNQLQIGNNTLTLGSSTSVNGLIGSGGLVGGSTSKLKILSSGAFGSLLFSGTSGELFSLTEDVGGTVSLNNDIKIYDELNLINGAFNINGKILELANARITSSFQEIPVSGSPGYLIGNLTSDILISGNRPEVVFLPLPAGNITIRNLNIQGSRIVSLYGGSMAIARSINLAGTLFIASGATFDNGGENDIVNGGGTPVIIINGKFITRDFEGFTGPITSIPGIEPLLNSGCTIEYGRATPLYNNGDQTVTSRNDYQNLILSQEGTKTVGTLGFNPQGTVTIKDAAIFDCSIRDIGDVGTSLTMSGTSRLVVRKAGPQPAMSGTYNLTGGVIEFAGPNAVTIRGTSTYAYKNIEVTGTNVKNSTGLINLLAGGTFTVKNGGVFEISGNGITGPSLTQTLTVENGGRFKTSILGGFYSSNGAVRTDIENVILNPGSTIEYSRDELQNITNTHPYQNLEISGLGIGSVKTAPAGTLTVQGNLTKTGTSTFAHNSGKVLLNGTTQSLDGLPFYDLEITNGTKTFNGSGKIANTLNLTNNTNLALANNAVITMGSIIDRTASVYPITGSSSITYGTNSSFEIERYLRGAKAWRLLATPVSGIIGTTIAQSWQDGLSSTTIPTGYGTRITGPSVTNGIDEFTQRGSMKWFSEATQNYVEITNTYVPIARNEGYYLFVRGDRGVGISGGPGITTLRIKGQLNVGNKDIPVAANKFVSVGNPYASRIDFRNTILTGGLATTFTTWDPTLPGLYGVGQFQTWSLNGSRYYLNGITTNPTRDFIESGEAFFIQANASAGNLRFVEGAKAIGSFNVSRTGEAGRNTSIDGSMEIKLLGNDLSGNKILADGVAINFDAGYVNEIDHNDVRKFNNATNNLSIKKSGILLTVDRRPLLNTSDTIFLNLGNFLSNNYAFIFDPANLFTSGLQCELIDNFSNSRTHISLIDSNYISFVATSNPASKASDRFMLVFKTSTVLPLTFTSITAAAQNNNVITNWKVENEIDIVQYELQRSADGRNFLGANTQAARGNNAPGILSYSWLDTNPLRADNYYRVLSTGINGEKKYSDIVRVNMGKGIQPISVFPNPMTDDKNLSISFVGKTAGVYLLSLVNAEGQVVYREKITHNGTNQQYPVQVNASLTRGTYMLTVRGEDQSLFSTKMVY